MFLECKYPLEEFNGLAVEKLFYKTVYILLHIYINKWLLLVWGHLLLLNYSFLWGRLKKKLINPEAVKCH